MFTIDIGYTTENIKKVNKAYTTIQSGVNISPLSTISQLSPVFVINYDSRFLNANYVVCSTLGRKYFCKVSVDTAQRMILTCMVDYYSSFDLSNCKIHVVRNGGIGSPTDYPDTKYPIKPNQKEITSIVRTTSELNVNYPYGYILTVIGGSS